MTVYVDHAAIPHKGTPRHHLAADSVAELHEFAARIGVARCWFHRGAKVPHYDVTDAHRLAALGAGAMSVSSRDLVRAQRGA